MPCKDPEARKAYNKAYGAAHSEEIAAQKRAYYAAHSEEIAAQKRAYYAEHSEERAAQQKAYHAAHSEERKAYCDAHATEIICAHCGKHAKMYIRAGQPGKFCSLKCVLAWQVGPNHPGWRGGISFEPYCPKFTKNLRMRVRAWFEHRCVICGRTKAQVGKNLAVHHVEYNKQACCNGEPVQFAPLCTSCHSRSNGSEANRARWEAMLHVIIHEIYHGRSYFTTDEWTALHPTKCSINRSSDVMEAKA